LLKRQITVSDLARLLDGEPQGELQRPLTGVATLEAAEATELAFLDPAQVETRARQSRAGCLLVPSGAKLPGRTVIRVSNPRRAMARAAEWFHPAKPPAPGIHSTANVGHAAIIGQNVSVGPQAVIGDGCRIGDRTTIGAGCILGEGATVGEDCVLYPRVTLYPQVRIGARVTLHSGSVIGSDGFGYLREAGGYLKFPQVGWVEIGDDVEIGANTTVDRGALGPTRIGRGTKIDNLVQIGHNVQIGEHCAIAALVGISGSVIVGDNVVIAGQVGIGDHARIEAGAVLGGQCGILPHKIIRAGQTVWGTPARPLKEHLAQQATLARLTRRKLEPGA
jgi:UDP-3-O-[3-hydroxymyristoyl] glucosamine N-acyltransferase